MSEYDFETQAIHGGEMPDVTFAPRRFPVFDSAAFQYAKSEDLENVFRGRRFGHVYSRISNPTVMSLERKLTVLESGTGAVAVASGMAAIFTALLTLTESGDKIIAHKSLFGGTYNLLHEVFKRYNVEVEFLDLTDSLLLEGAIDKKTRAVFVETIGNPQMDVVDIKQLAAIADSRQVPLVVDSTVTTPWLFRAKAFGAAVVVHSCTKYLTGNGSVVGGAIIDTGNFNWSTGSSPRLKQLAKRAGDQAFLYSCRKEILQNTGACLSPASAEQHIAGIETLALRMERHCDNALAVARHLVKSPTVKSVNYPGLESNRFYKVASKQFSERYGGILTVDLETKDKCFRFIQALKLIRQMANIGDVRTLVIHPGSTIFADFNEQEKNMLGITDGLVRISVGIESARNIIQDIDSALKEL